MMIKDKLFGLLGKRTAGTSSAAAGRAAAVTTAVGAAVTAERAGTAERTGTGERTRGRSLGNVLMGLALTVGTILLVYPSASDYWNSFHQSRSIMGYAEQVAQMTAADYAKFISEAEEYNARLAENGIEWHMSEAQMKEYESRLTFSSTGIMGYIDIPKINIKLPIYHGTSEAVLQTSIGHIAETSLPVGGSGSHCVLSGHRGLPSAKLFSDLDKVMEGDTFTISVLNETYTYQVDQIRVVEPTDIRELELRPGMDLCTLVTCTPYGINSHRMLVRGRRVENADGSAKVIADAMQLKPVFVAPFLMMFMILGLMVKFFLIPAHRHAHTDIYDEVWEDE